MSDHSYTFNGIKAILDHPSEKLSANAKHSSHKNKTTEINPLNELLNKFINNLKYFTASIPAEIKKQHLKIDKATQTLDQQTINILNPTIDNNAVVKILIEITIILVREFFDIKDIISDNTKEEAIQLVNQAAHIIELYQDKEIELQAEQSYADDDLKDFG